MSKKISYAAKTGGGQVKLSDLDLAYTEKDKSVLVDFESKKLVTCKKCKVNPEVYLYGVGMCGRCWEKHCEANQ